MLPKRDAFRRFTPTLALLLIVLAAGFAALAAPADFAFRDLSGARHALRPETAKVTIYLFLATRCPVANRYTPRIQALANTYTARGVSVFGVYPNAADSAKDITQSAAERGYRFPVVKDNGGALAARLGATHTPEAIVLDAAGTVRYRGRIDDSPLDPGRVTARDLQTALDTVLAGRTVARASAPVEGCVIMPGKAVNAAAAVTYARDVAPILQKNCVSCHRAGEVAPFSVETYKETAAWAEQIKLVTQKRQMPPWKAVSHGQFHDERRLTDAQIKTLAVWADAGAPAGDLRNLPPAPKFAARGTWKLGTPDRVIEMPEAYTVSADGRDVYQCFVIPGDHAEDKWINAFEVQPGNRAVVHHVIAYLDTSGKARELDAKDPAPGYTSPTPGNPPGIEPVGALAAWVPGTEPRALPPGVANRWPKNADIVLEVHYHPNGTPQKDRTRFGVYYAKGPVEKRIRALAALNTTFNLPPGVADHEVRAAPFLASGPNENGARFSLSDGVPEDITLVSIAPHMHLLGRAMMVTATLPDKTTRTLIDLQDWDFNWQMNYVFKQPVKLPKGTRIDMVARYDNSEANPRNPAKPPRPVKWGEQSTDEMCLVVLTYTRDAKHLSAAVARK